MGRGRTSRREALRSVGAVARWRDARAIRGVGRGGGRRNARLECDAFGFEGERGCERRTSRWAGAMSMSGRKPQGWRLGEEATGDGARSSDPCGMTDQCARVYFRI